MTPIILFRQHRIFLPTILGWLLILLIFVVTNILIMKNIYSILAQNNPVGANVLVVEGWLDPEELDQAVQAYKRGGYQHLVTTGGPLLGWPELAIHSNYAKMAADYFVLQGIPRNEIHVVPSPASAQERTFLSAVILRESAQKLGFTLETIDLFSSGAHARRSRLLFQMALGPNTRVGVLAARPSLYNPNAWWRSSNGVQSIVVQSIGLLWVKCFF